MRRVHTEEVTGSIPVSPTRSEAISIFEEISAGAKSGAIRYGARDGGRRGWGEDFVYFDHSGECRDPDSHRHCLGRWRGVVSLKSGPDGKRRRKKVSGRNKTEVRAKLAELHEELNDGLSATWATPSPRPSMTIWPTGSLAGCPRRSERNGKSSSRCSRSSGMCRCAS